MWNTGDGSKYAGDYNDLNETITSAVVSHGVLDLSCGVNEYGYEKGVFQCCTKLQLASLPDSLRRIGDYGFHACYALLHVNIPSGVTHLGISSFQSCQSIETVTIPEGIINLPQRLFYDCKSLKSARLPRTLKTIGDYAFANCFSLDSINFDALGAVEEIGKSAFTQCSSLTTFKLPPLLKIIESGIFSKCKGLSKVDLPPSLDTIKTYAFDGCHPDLSIDLPETTAKIQWCALYGCRIRLPASLAMIKNGGHVEGLLQGVKEVVTSAWVDLNLLVDYLHDLPKTKKPFLRPDLKFKMLHCGSSRVSSASLPHLKEHIPKRFFSFDLSPGELKSIRSERGDHALLSLVESAFSRKLSLYVEVLKCKAVVLPAEVSPPSPFISGVSHSAISLYSISAFLLTPPCSLAQIMHYIVPFIYGEEDLTDEVLGDIVAAVRRLEF